MADTHPQTAAKADKPQGVALPIAIKLALLLLLASLVPLTISTVLNGRRGLHTVEATALHGLELLASVTATEIDRLILDIGNLQSLMSRSDTVVVFCAATPEHRNLHLPGVQRMLDNIKATNPDIASAFVTDADGIGIASTSENNVGQDLNFRKYMQAALRGERYTSEVLVGKTTGRPGIYFSGPVRDEEDTVVGTLVIKLAGERIHAICNSADVGGTGFVSLTDRLGIILANPNPDTLYRSLAPLDESLRSQVDAETRYGLDRIESIGLDPGLARKLMDADARGSESFVVPQTGETMIVSYAPMVHRDWVVSVVKPRSDFDRPLRQLQRQQQLSLVLLGILAAVAGVLLSKHFVRPIQRLTDAALRLAQGDYSVRAPSATHDEVGQLTNAFNDMVPQLEQRAQMANALRVAEEIQQGLLPSEVPDIDGLDIAGLNVPADETGGDYYDYLDLRQWMPGTVAVAVGDITGHGIPAALLMCTARSLLRARATPPGPLPEFIAGVNNPLYHDTPASRFMTLMVAVLERPNRRLRLVSAGHDPVIVYDPDEDKVFEIEGHDIPLGIQPDWEFTETVYNELPPRAVLLFGTDGIWETRRPNEGDLYEKAPLHDILRQHHHDDANTIVNVILQDLYAFRGGEDQPQLDDITIVVVKLTPETDNLSNPV